MSSIRQYPLYINGEHIWSTPTPRLTVTNPSRGTAVSTFPTADRTMVETAIEAAHAAFPKWAGLPAKDRATLLTRVADALRADIDRLAAVLTEEQGKPLAEARAELGLSADYLTWFAEEAKRARGETIPAASADKRLWTIRTPVGVVGAITPWNFPASMVARKIAPALAAGCTVVLKPSAATPNTAAELVELFHQAGFPPGVVNLVVGPAQMVGDVLTASPLVRKISFTGSTEVGKQLIQAAAGTVKRLSLELGGHAPVLVFDDADIDAAVSGVVASKFRNAGQTCICANRLYVQRSILEPFQTRLVDAVSRLKVGDGFDPDVAVGPLINQAAHDGIVRQVDDAVQRGGAVLVGGRRMPTEHGMFFLPTVIGNVADDALLSREETFGPLIGIRPFDHEDEALQLANDTPYGLAAYVFTRDIGRVTRVTEGLEYGIIGVNDPLPTVVQGPFGGLKESGWGKEGGWQGLDAYLETKFVSLRL